MFMQMQMYANPNGRGIFYRFCSMVQTILMQIFFSFERHFPIQNFEFYHNEVLIKSLFNSTNHVMFT